MKIFKFIYESYQEFGWGIFIELLCFLLIIVLIVINLLKIIM